MQPAKETASNIAASAKSGMDKTKAVAQEQVDKVSAHGPMGKEMAREKKDARVAEAEATKREAKMQNAAARQGEQVTGGYGNYTTGGQTGYNHQI
uniref:Late embryogenesis abundant (Lea) group 1-embryo development n=1 Tax=Linum usitatissimum TaxID=4006 RepID=A0A165G0J6_LINUS|nr:late embryogenesis abundant (lea) group 1-embryo development [Linum usitatissimum]